MTLLEGKGTTLGHFVGAFAIVGMENYFAGLRSWVTIIMGIAFVVCVLAFCRGIIGEINAGWARRAAGRS